MNIKRLFGLLACCVIPLVSAMPAQKVLIKAEIAAPLILENVQDKNYLKISLTGYPLEIRQRSPINLALVIDRSSSMNSQNRIEKARDAAIMAVNLLNEKDTLSIVTYDSVVEVIVPPTKVKNKAALIKAIQNKTEPRGMTALFAGVSKGLQEVGKRLDKEQVNRIILLSDGQANVGPTSVSELSELSKMAAKKGVAITTLGIGSGYNEDLMTAIANYSDGNHAFVERSSDLEAMFAREFNDVMSVVAQDVEVEIALANGVTPLRLLGREGQIRGNTVTVKLNQLYSNQEKYVLLEVIPAKGTNAQTKPLAEVRVNYDNLGTKQKDSYTQALAVRYTASASEAKNAVIDEVLVDSAIQQMALENEKAVKLMDEGKVSEAKSVLNKSTEELRAAPAMSPKAVEKLQGSVVANEALIQKLENNDKNTSRKALKAQSYNLKKQKSAP